MLLYRINIVLQAQMNMTVFISQLKPFYFLFTKHRSIFKGKYFLITILS